jgi:hypothetical protein
MIEEATDDAYRDSEQTTGWYTMLDEYLALPFETTSKSVMLDGRTARARIPSDRPQELPLS